MKKKTKLMRDGKFIRFLEDDEKYALQDDESISIGMAFMDSADPVAHAIAQDQLARQQSVMHRPGPVTLTDAQLDDRMQAYDRHDKSITEAWKNPAPLSPDALANPAKGAPVVVPPASNLATHQAARDAAYDRRDKALESAWME